jgi:ketosteroid isomerase-like protein
MSQENVQTVRRATDAFNRGDLDAFLANFAPEAEWHPPGQFIGEGVYRGHAELKRFWAEAREDLEELSTSVSEIRAVGEDKVFVAAVGAGRGKRSEARFEQPLWYVMTVRDGLILRVEDYVDPAQALEAAGLSE